MYILYRIIAIADPVINNNYSIRYWWNFLQCVVMTSYQRFTKLGESMCALFFIWINVHLLSTDSDSAEAHITALKVIDDDKRLRSPGAGSKSAAAFTIYPVGIH